MSDFLKLDFNERSDKESAIAKSYTFGKDLWQYPDRETLEKQLAKLNQLTDSQVMCTNGGDEAIMLLMRLTKEAQQNSDLSQTTQLILPLPAFSQYTWGIKSWQLNTQLISANTNLTINVKAIKQSIESSQKSITIITRPNNPTGELIERETLIQLLKIAKDNDGWIFLDEAYIEFSGQDSLNKSNQLLQEFNNLVILRTLSKAYGLAGIRLGYLLGNKKLINQFKERCIPFNISAPTLNIASQALGQENQVEVNNYCKTINNNREEIMQWLTQNNIQVFPSSANFIFLALPKNQAKAIQSFLKKNNVLVRCFQENELVDCLRITIPFSLEKLFPLLKQSLTPGLICLDMDGVLINTSDSYDESIKATVKQLSGKIIVQSDIEKLRQGGGFNNDWVLTQTLLKNLGFDFDLEEVTRIFQQLYLGNNNDGFVSNEKVILSALLRKKIKQASQTTFAIVTGRPREETKAGKKLIKLEQLESISLDDVKEGKPSPEGIEKLKQKYTKLSWMCGDNPDDMQAASKSNSLAIGIGSKNAASLYQAGADIVLHNINELEAWLEPIK